MWEDPNEALDIESLNSDKSSSPVEKFSPVQWTWSSNHGFSVMFYTPGVRNYYLHNSFT